MEVGLLCAFIALFGWGFGDFFLQKVTRMLDAHKALFCTCVVGATALLPFVWRELPSYGMGEYRAVAILGGLGLVGALALLTAFRHGKLSVVESTVAFEVPLAVALGVLIGGEILAPLQLALFAVVCVGVLLAAAARIDHLHYHKRIFEKGVVLALVSAIVAALVDFSIGVYAQNISPLFLMWGMSTIMATLCGTYMWAMGEFRAFWRTARQHPRLILTMSAFDNAGWIGYAYAVSMMPVSLTMSIAGSYIAFAALLGFFLNREKMSRHQLVGASIAFVGVTLLAATV
jgi:drug/metabolite transporter (DMT)-like permease